MKNRVDKELLQRLRKNWNFLVLFALILGSGFYIFVHNVQIYKTYNQEDLSRHELEIKLLSVQPDDFTLGSDAPIIRMVLYTDTDCPFCKKYETAITELLEKHDSKIAITYRNFDLPLFPFSRYEHHALECVGILTDAETYREFQNEVLFAGTLEGVEDPYSSVFKEAEQFIPKHKRHELETCIYSENTTQRLQAKETVGKILGVNKTPTTFFITTDNKVNRIVGNLSYENIVSRIHSLESSF